MGTLKAAKKRGIITFEGQLLLKGSHDKARISPRNCARLPCLFPSSPYSHQVPILVLNEGWTVGP
jgi:hypothetical protein